MHLLGELAKEKMIRRKHIIINLAILAWMFRFEPIRVNRYLAGQIVADGANGTSKMFLQNHQRPTERPEYMPGQVEQYVIDHAEQLGLTDDQVTNETRSSCAIFLNPNTSPHYEAIHRYRAELAEYGELVRNFTAIPDIRKQLGDSHDICRTLDLVPGGLSSLFPSGQLSWTHAGSGIVEPLIPPLRHPEFCMNRTMANLMRLDYLVHDFRAMCESLKETSRIILVDMGASLNFHANQGSPAIFLIQLYRRFGFHFDHIYAYEIKPTQPEDVFISRLPRHLRSSFHWINVGVSAEPESLLNPLNMILESFGPDDLIVVKLDIDTSSIEEPLAQQLLQNERLAGLVDQFYFEHHVNQKELAPFWRRTMRGSIKKSLDLFQGLRRKGIAAHYWV